MKTLIIILLKVHL